MDGENRTPDKKIGEVKQAEEQAARTTGHKPPHGPGMMEEKDELLHREKNKDPR